MQLGKFDRKILIPSAARTATFNSDADKAEGFSKAYAYLDVTAVSGTSPSLAVKIQESPDGTNWFDSGYQFTAVTAVGKQRLVLSDFGGVFYRAVCTITGTSPSFTFSLDIVGKN